MIYINYGDDISKTTYETLKASDIISYLNPDYSVSIKPNLVVARPADGGATTHPEVVEGIINFLRDFGIKKINIIEGSWVGDSTKRAFKVCGYDRLSEKYGIPVVDLKSDSHRELKYRDFGIKICEQALDTDFLINVPVLKAHCQTDLTCCMKNLKGCLPDSEKRRFHSLGLHKPIAVLSALLKTGYCVVDGICGDLSFEEGGNPVVANRIIAGRDPLLIDSYCSALIGYSPEEIGYLTYGRSIGLGEFCSDKTKIIELNPENKPMHLKTHDRVSERYRKIINEDSACSACFSSLIYALHRLGGNVRNINKINIGQGFKGKNGEGIGIGSCTGGFSKSIAGCPPSANDISEFLSSLG